MRSRIAFLALGMLIAVVSPVTVAVADSAASSQNLYGAFVTDGSAIVDSYQPAVFKAFLADSTVHEYGDRHTLGQLDFLARQVAQRSSLPASGFQMIIAGVVAVVLIGGGLLLRRLSRKR